MRFLFAAVLPLVAALPSYPRAQVGRRVVLKSDAAMAQFNFQPYQLTHMAVQCSKGVKDLSTATGLYNCTLSFDWFDPNSVPENNISSTSCSSSWSWDGATGTQGEKNTYSTNYQLCQQKNFEVRFLTFENGTNFQLELAHEYKDDQNFTAPYDYPQTFAQVSPHLEEVTDGGAGYSMRFAAPSIIYANITSVSD